MKAICLFLTTILLCAALYATEQEKELLFPDHHLCLEASGKVTIKADKAVFSFDTKAFGATLRIAVTNAQNKVAELTSSLTAIGIDPNSFSTAGFASGRNSDAFFLTDKKDYSATLSTTVTLRDLTKLDEAVLILTDKKAENLSGISFSLDDPSAARQRARQIAFNRIAEQRDTICGALGVKITDVQLIDEAPFEPLPWGSYDPYYSMGVTKGYSSMNQVAVSDMMEPTPGMSDSSGGFFSPEMTVEIQVRVIYRIGLQQ
jgi:uncharacterized protein YggE